MVRIRRLRGKPTPRNQRALSVKAAIVLVLFTVLVTTSCTSLTPKPSPETKYFVLDTPPSAKPPALSAKQAMILPIRLPEYLNQQQLVVREKNHQIRIAKYHSWAEPLEVSIRRSITNQLNQKDLGYSFVSSCSRCPRLLVDIHHFYPTVDGVVLLSGGYRFDGFPTESSLHTEGANSFHAFHYNAELKADGYAAAVKEMRSLLGMLADEMASTVAEPRRP